MFKGGWIIVYLECIFEKINAIPDLIPTLLKTRSKA
jgi:hypothetical protein